MNSRFKNAGGANGTQALRRGLAVLKAFTDETPQHTLAGITAQLGLNKTTAYRLLGALEAEGLLVREGEAYRLGPEAMLLGARASRARDLVSAGHAELSALAHDTGETATLEVLAGDEVLIVDEVQGRHLVASVPAVGTRWPAHATATGKVLLAFGARRPAGRLTKHTRATITTVRRLGQELQHVIDQGYGTNMEELEAGFIAVAAPVRDHTERVIAAVSVGGPAIRLAQDRITIVAARAKRAAARISQQLGSRA